MVADRNRFTGGGITADIGFGLTLLAELRGENAAKMTQFMIEYDPAPFKTGHPRSAGPELAAGALRLMGNMNEVAVETAKTGASPKPLGGGHGVRAILIASSLYGQALGSAAARLPRLG